MISENEREEAILYAYEAWKINPDNQFTKDMISLVVGDIIVETIQENIPSEEMTNP